MYGGNAFLKNLENSSFQWISEENDNKAFTIISDTLYMYWLTREWEKLWLGCINVWIELISLIKHLYI